MSLIIDSINADRFVDVEVKVGHFPDNTQAIKALSGMVPEYRGEELGITWDYRNDEELVTLWFVANHLQQLGFSLRLTMAYIPNARMDRVQEEGEIFTLKHFAKLINQMNFSRVIVLDPHSTVSEALFDRLVVVQPDFAIEEVINQAKPGVVFMPDEGAHKRYSKMVTDLPTTFGIKHRDWKTGNILDYEVVDGSLVVGEDVLIIDDISSKGGTFYYAALALKEAGAKSVSLYVSHLEETIKLGELLEEHSPIKDIYTADPLFDLASNPELTKKIHII